MPNTMMGPDAPNYHEIFVYPDDYRGSGRLIACASAIFPAPHHGGSSTVCWSCLPCAIKRATREYDFPARLDGGLFGVLLPEPTLPPRRTWRSARVNQSSFRAALDTDRGHLPEDLIREADMAMYRAVGSGPAQLM